jgi:hypothetical protein
MRYYSIKITDPDSGEVIRPKVFEKLGLEESYTSYVNGKNLAAALDVELNIPIYNYAVPLQNAFVRIFGVSYAELSQSTSLEGKNIEVKGGMQKGLPLAKPEQNGVLVEGRIFQSIGNNLGLERSLDLILIPNLLDKPANFSFSWPANTILADAIRATLKTAMTGYTLKIEISDDLKLAADVAFTAPKLEDFSSMILRITSDSQFAGITTLSKSKYRGVNITIKGMTVIVYDDTKDHGGVTIDDPKKILFEDMIGQPTWLAASTIALKTVLRADISVGDFIQLPEKLNRPYVLTTVGSAFPNTPARNESAFKGKFQVVSVHHMARFRQSTADAWVTLIAAIFIIDSDKESANTSNQGSGTTF